MSESIRRKTRRHERDGRLTYALAVLQTKTPHGVERGAANTGANSPAAAPMQPTSSNTRANDERAALERLLRKYLGDSVEEPRPDARRARVTPQDGPALQSEAS